MAYTDVFGGELIFPSKISYLAITTAVDLALQWPTEQQITGDSVVADIMDVTTTAGGLNIDMPSAMVTAPGNKATFNNVGGNAFTVRDSTGGTIQTVQPGEQWVLTLTDNTTDAGTWTTFQLGASVAVASASALAGAGIKAIGVLLNQQIDSDVEPATPITVVEGDRAKCLIYTGGAGVADLPGAGAVGNDWFFMIRNSGTGTLAVTPAAGTIDGSVSINLDPNDSAFVFTDGANFFTIGLSSGSTIAFDFVSLPIPGSGDFVLSGANLNRIAYRFTGALTGNRKVVVPTTTQQYWVDNSTTGAFVLEIATAAQPTPIQIGQGDTAILYCDATNVINGTTSTSIVFPITIAQGGTSANNAAAALINLGAAADSIDLIAGDGIVGGGDLTANRTFDFDLASIGAVAPALGDFIVLQDIDGGDINIKATLTDVFALIPSTAPEELVDSGANVRISAETGGLAQLRSTANSDFAPRQLQFTHQDETLRAFVGYTTNATFRISSEIDNQRIVIQGRDSGSALRTVLDGWPSFHVGLYYQGAETLRTQDRTALGVIGGVAVEGGDGTFRSSGYAEFAPVIRNTGYTFDQAFANRIIYTTSLGQTYTTPASTDSTLPIGAWWKVVSLSGLTIGINAGAGITIRWLDGAGSVTGNRILADGGIATVMKAPSNEYWVWGDGLS